MADEATPFRVIEGGGKAKQYRAKVKGEPEPLVCGECDSTASMEIVVGRMVEGGKVKGGTKLLVCAWCRHPLI